MSYITTWEENGVYRKFSGQISGEEILASDIEMHNHPLFLDIRYVINDFIDITGHSITPSHTSVYAKTDEIISASVGRIKIALVASEEYEPIANSYIEQMSDKTFKCKLFRTTLDAREWVIGLSS